MASVKYSYSVADDTLNGAVAGNALKGEIETASIVTALDYIVTSGDSLDIWFKSDLSAPNQTELTAVVAGHSGVEAVSDLTQSVVITGAKDDFGNNVFTPTLDFSLGLTPKKKMHRHSVVASQINIFDEVVTTERRINGGEYWIAKGFASCVHADDYVEFSIIDKDDILGLFDYYSLVQGSDILELSKFVITDYVQKGDPITGHHTQCYEGIKGTSKVYPGLYYRVMYDSNGEEDLYILERFYYYE